MLTVGLGEPPASITGIKALVLDHFGIVRRACRVAWIDEQLRSRGIDDERVLAAMERVPRELFVPARLREARLRGRAAADRRAARPCPSRTSSPSSARRSASHGGERVLDVGTGSGYQAAVLAELAAEVHSIERIPELADEGARGARGRRATSA